MKTLPLALAIAFMSRAVLAADGTLATAHATQGAELTLSGGAPISAAAAGANGLASSFNGANGPVNSLQNSGDNAAQNAQNVLARVSAGGGGGPATADARGAQIARTSMQNAQFARAGGANAIAGSFNGASGMVNVLQNTGSNVVQNAQNSLAMVLRRP